MRIHKYTAAIAFCLVATALTACQQDGATTGQSGAAKGGFFDKLGNAITEGVKNGIDNGIQTTDTVGVLGYTMMPSKLAGRDEPAYCLENPVTRKIITVAPMFGRPYIRPDGTTGFVQMAKYNSPHTDKIEVNLNGVLPGSTCADLISSHRLIPGVAPASYYYTPYGTLPYGRYY